MPKPSLTSSPDLLALAQRIAELEAQVAEQTLAQRCHTLLSEQLADGFCVIELLDGPDGPLSDYRYVHTNPACARHSGHRKQMGQTAREVIGDEVRRWAPRFAEVWKTGEATRFVQPLHLTSHVLDLAVHRLEPSSTRQVAIIFSQVEGSADQQALRQRNSQLERRIDQVQADRRLFGELVDSSLANVFVIDRRMRLLAVNRTARETFQRVHGFVPMVGEEVEQCLVDQPILRDLLVPLWLRALRGESFIENVRLDGPAQRRHYELRFNPFRSEDGHIEGAYLFAYDITERILEQERLLEVQAALRQTQKVEAIGQLTGGIAHDFNNLLGSITAGLELAGQRLSQANTEEAIRLTGLVQHDAERAAALVQRLLAFSRRQTLMPVPTDLRTLVAGMQSLIQSALGSAIEMVDLTRVGVWPTCIDPNQLENTLLNLCLNARDALPHGGRVQIGCENTRIGSAWARELQLSEGDYLHVFVSDNGCGMPPEIVERAIDPFFTTKPLGHGTGLGLSTAFGFVRQSGGQLHIESRVGLGTQVHLYLPRHAETPMHTSAPVKPRLDLHAVGAGRKVMLVEDQVTLCRIFTDVLQEVGYQVLAFPTAAAAYATLQGGATPALLVTDIVLPGGMSGRQLASLAKALHPALPVLFITGHDEQLQADDAHGPGDDDPVLVKPFGLQTLVASVTRLLER